MIALRVSVPVLGEAFPLTAAIWSTKDIYVPVPGCSLSCPLFAEDTPKSLSLVEQFFFFFILA